MAREYVRIRISIADDEEFENLSPEAQWLYLRVMLPEPSLNYAGVCDWRPNRLVGKARGIDLAYILRGAAELEEERYALFDTATEEAMARTFIRNDELLRNPKMAPAVVKGYQSTASKVLRAAIVTEVQKAKEEHPEYTSWEHKDTKEDLARLLTKNGLDSVPYTNQIVAPITNTVPGTDYQSDSVPIPSLLAPNTTHQSPDTFDAPSGAKTKRGTRLPGEFMPSAESIATAKAECPSINLEAEHRKFVDYWKGKSGKDATKLDWDATWRNWIRNARTPQTQNGSSSTVDDKVNGWLEMAGTSQVRELE